jgi:hypothetical protein
LPDFIFALTVNAAQSRLRIIHRHAAHPERLRDVWATADRIVRQPSMVPLFFMRKG